MFPVFFTGSFFTQVLSGRKEINEFPTCFTAISGRYGYESLRTDKLKRGFSNLKTTYH